jgi:DNA-binding MarR family transcriptional regulator
MTASTGTGSTALAEETFGLLYELVGRMRAHFDRVTAQFGLPPTQAKALLQLSEPVPMSALAGILGCDPSNVTAIIDGLESLGLAERRVSARDRRVKQVVATAKGTRLRRQLNRALFESMPTVDTLDPEEQLAFRDLLRKGLGVTGGPPGSAPPRRTSVTAPR